MARSIGVVDMGTNTLKFSVTRVDTDGEQSIVHAHAETVRLGAGIGTSGMIDPDRIDLTLEALRSYEATAKLLGVEACVGVATAALRIAGNGADLLDRISRTTGWKVSVISDVEEARLTHIGLADFLPESGDALLVDVGGGSTEVISVRNRDLVSSESLEIGSGTLADRCFAADPPGVEAVHSAANVAAEVLRPSTVLDSQSGMPLYLSGGNGQFLSQLASWEQVAVPFTPGAFPHLLDAVAMLGSQQSAAYLGVVRERARMIPAGAAIAMAVIRTTSPASVTAVPSGIRGGLVKDWIANNPR